jgi:hypothetical protein
VRQQCVQRSAEQEIISIAQLKGFRGSWGRLDPLSVTSLDLIHPFILELEGAPYMMQLRLQGMDIGIDIMIILEPLNNHVHCQSTTTEEQLEEE